jgi:hypothetical protein
MKKTLLLSALASLLSISATSNVMAHDMTQDQAAFGYAVKHANFMPTLMMYAVKNADSLGLSATQLDELKAYTAKNSPTQRNDMIEVVALEKQAAEAGLNKDLGAARVAGDKAIALRQAIFNQKIECYKKVQGLLTAEQFDKLKAMVQQAQ